MTIPSQNSEPSEQQPTPGHVHNEPDMNEYHIDMTVTVHILAPNAIAAANTVGRHVPLPASVSITRIVVQEVAPTDDDCGDSV